VERLAHSEGAADQVAVVSPGSVVVEIGVAVEAGITGHPTDDGQFVG